MAPIVVRECSIDGCHRSVKARGLCNPHYMDAWRMAELPTGPRKVQEVSDPLTRWLAKVNKNGPIPDYAPHLGRCWIWTGATTKNGYGRFQPGRRGNLVWNAHRWGYVQLVGPVDDDKHLDHLCRVRCCVNPTHLEPVTMKENLARGARGRGAPNADGIYSCRNGHLLTPENSRPRKDCDGVACRTCLRETMRRSRARKKS